MDVGPLFKANAQPPQLIQPGQSQFHYPLLRPKLAAILHVSLEPRPKCIEHAILAGLPFAS